ncbi:MAG: MFS transporter, partial [Acidimicrobiia bacterium]
VPGLVLGLAAGVWVDRFRRRPVLIVTDMGRALLLLSIPGATLVGDLTLTHLYLVAFGASVLTTFFNVAYLSYLPSIVSKEQILQANSRVSASASVSEVAAFAAGGWLVQLFGAPTAVLIDATTFVASALFILSIRRPEPTPELPVSPNLRREVTEGIRLIAGDRVQRALMQSSFLIEMSFWTMGAVYLFFITKEIGVAPGLQGLIYSVGGASSFAAAAIVPRISHRTSVGRALRLSIPIAAGGYLLTTFVRRPNFAGISLMVGQQLIGDSAAVIVEINTVSLRQTITPSRVLGRVNAAVTVANLLGRLLGSLIGGALGQYLGLRQAYVIGCVGMALAVFWFIPKRTRSAIDVIASGAKGS